LIKNSTDLNEHNEYRSKEACCFENKQKGKLPIQN